MVTFCQLAYHPQLGSYGTHDALVFAFNENPASLSETKHLAAGFFGEKKFLLKETGDYYGAFSIPAGKAGFGIMASYGGSVYFHSSSFSLAYGRSLGEKIQAGVQFIYENLSFGGLYGATGILYPKAGFIVKLSTKLRTGMAVSDPLGTRFGKDDQEKRAGLYSFGIGYLPSEKFFIEFLLHKEEDKIVSPLASIQYRLLPSLLITAGINSTTSCFWLGIGFMIGGCRVDVTAESYSQIGITPGTLVQFVSKK